jgi:AcrR family transcriptional regulator
MTKTLYADYDTRRDAILETAAALFAKNGFSATSISELAEACKTSKSLIYHYFPAKEDILFEVMDGYIQSLAEAAFRVDLETMPAEAKLRGLARDLLALYAGAPAHHKIVFQDLQHLPAPRRAEIVEVQRKIMAVFDRLLASLRPALRGHVRRRPMVMMFFGLLNSTWTWFDPSGPMTSDTVADIAVDMFLGGLPAQAPPA